MIMGYKVVPFNSQKFDTSENVANELERIIEKEAVNGYKYINHEYSDKLQPGSSGCFGIGAKSDTVTHVGFVVFEKQ